MTSGLMPCPKCGKSFSYLLGQKEAPQPWICGHCDSEIVFKDSKLQVVEPITNVDDVKGKTQPQWFKVDCILSGNLIASQEVLAEDKDKARDKFLTDLPNTLKFKVSKSYKNA